MNISGKPLSECARSILSKGLNFCPTPTNLNKQKTLQELDDLQRNLSLKVHFHNENKLNNQIYIPSTLEKIAKKRNKHPFQPPHENSVLAYTDAIKDEIIHCKRKNIPYNVTKEELEAINNLASRTDIVIKRADKGGAVVVCSSEWYRAEALRQLNDNNYYKQVEHDDTKKHEDIVSNKVKEFTDANIINRKLAKQLTPLESRTPEFYLLPKTHKPTITGRPVISSTGCHTETISAFVDQHLQPAAEKLPSYIKDSNDFVSKMKMLGRISPRDILVTLDVSSLYTNIDNSEGIEALRQNETIKSRYTQPFINMICVFMNLILTLNNFIFNGINYHQIKGTAMGTRAAPNYANIFMGWYEKLNIMDTSWKDHITFYGRYIDDIMFIWKSDEHTLLEFFKYLNAAHNTIKFTWEYSRDSINFLDIKLIKDPKGYLSTDLYKKKTDTNGYLHRTSAHPTHCKDSIPYSQFLRLKRIVTEPVKLRKRFNEFIEYFTCSGYSRKSLKSTAAKVLAHDPSPRPPQDASRNTTRLITTYNELLPDMQDMIKKHWTITQTNKKCRNALTESPQIVYKRNKNLSDFLVRAKYRHEGSVRQRGIHKVSKCNNCSWCKNITEGSEFQSRHTGEIYKILHKMSCVSPWVIYLCECAVHKKQYVGKSETKLTVRMNNNRYHLKLPNPMCKLVQHFKGSTECNLERDMKLMPIEHLRIADDTTRRKDEIKETLRRREIFWQNKLQTLHPNGLNKREG